jgi:ATP-dependent RNA helicase DeaD
MPDTFDDLGITPALAAAAADLGWAAPTALQRDAVPIIRRGHNVVLHASAGAGAAGAYGLGLVDRLAADESTGPGDAAGPRVLVVGTGADTASRLAESLAPLAAAAGRTIRALAPGWPERPTDLVVGSAESVLASVRDSSLKLEGLAALVVHGAEQLADLGQWAALETLLEVAPGGAQRIMVTGRLDAEMESFTERHVRRAMTVPPRPADAGEPVEPTDLEVPYRIATEAEKAAAVAEFVSRSGAGEVAVVCRTADRAARLAAELGARGLPVAGAGGSPDPEAARVLVLSRTEADRRSTQADVVSYDVPVDAATLVDLHARGGLVLTTAGQVAHLRQLAARAAARLEAVRPAARPALPGVERIRARLRDTARHADLAADLALIEPLLDEFTAPELAAAALHLARAAGAHAAPADGPAAAVADLAASRTTTAPASGAPSAPPPATTWVRLFVSAGSRDGLGPGDLVGAITGETGLDGSKVGKIDVRESHSTVEVPSEVAAAVIQALNGRSLRGRSLRVDYDRRERTPRRAPGRTGPRAGGGGAGGAGGRRPRPGGPPRRG